MKYVILTLTLISVISSPLLAQGQERQNRNEEVYRFLSQFELKAIHNPGASMIGARDIECSGGPEALRCKFVDMSSSKEKGKERKIEIIDPEQVARLSAIVQEWQPNLPSLKRDKDTRAVISFYVAGIVCSSRDWLKPSCIMKAFTPPSTNFGHYPIL